MLGTLWGPVTSSRCDTALPHCLIILSATGKYFQISTNNFFSKSLVVSDFWNICDNVVWCLLCLLFLLLILMWFADYLVFFICLFMVFWYSCPTAEPVWCCNVGVLTLGHLSLTLVTFLLYSPHITTDCQLKAYLSSIFTHNALIARNNKCLSNQTLFLGIMIY